MASSIVSASPWRSRALTITDAGWGYFIGVGGASIDPKNQTSFILLGGLLAIIFASTNPAAKLTQILHGVVISRGWKEEEWYSRCLDGLESLLVPRPERGWRKHRISSSFDSPYLSEALAKLSSLLYLFILIPVVLLLLPRISANLELTSTFPSDLLVPGVMILFAFVVTGYVKDFQDLHRKLQITALYGVMLQAKPRNQIQQLDNITNLIKSGNWSDAAHSLNYEILQGELIINGPEDFTPSINNWHPWKLTFYDTPGFTITHKAAEKMGWLKQNHVFAKRRGNELVLFIDFDR